MTNPYESPGNEVEAAAPKLRPLRFLLWTACSGFVVSFCVSSLAWSAICVAFSNESTLFFKLKLAVMAPFQMAIHTLGFALIVTSAITTAVAIVLAITTLAKRVL